MAAAVERVELEAVTLRFRGLVDEWDLGRADVAALLGTPAHTLGLDLVPESLDAEQERRLRLLVEIGRLLRSVCDARDVHRWLRTPAHDLADEDGETIGSVLAYLRGSTARLSAVRHALEHRAAA